MTSTPDGYKRNSKGHLVPLDQISELDQLRDELVHELIAGAFATAQTVREFKLDAASKIQAFIELSAQDHGVEYGGKKGNVQLVSYDGTKKVIRSVAELITFNEKMSIARECIFDCIAKWADGSNSNLVQIVRGAFERDANGHLSTAKILGLRRYNIDDPDWAKAMELIADAIVINDTAQYVRFYTRKGSEDKYIQIALDGTRV
jgi:hypothetical protein